MSFKKDNKFFKCFTCEVSGSVIDFVMQMFNLTKFEAAKKLSEDFNLGLFKEKLTPQKKKEIRLEFKKQNKYRLTAKNFETWVNISEKWFLKVFKFFRWIIENIKPRRGEELQAFWILAIHYIYQVEEILDILQLQSLNEKTKSYKIIENYRQILTRKITENIRSLNYDVQREMCKSN